MTRAVRRWLLLPLLAGVLLVHLGLAAANPWGLAADPADSRGQPADPRWIQGTNPPGAAPRVQLPDDGAVAASPAAAGASAWTNDWPSTGGPVPAAQPPGSEARGSDDRFGSDAGVSAPSPEQSGYRFRGDPPGLMGNGLGNGEGSPTAGAYQFRPLSERELGRQGLGADGRPAQSGVGLRPAAAPPAWAPGAPDGFRAGPWPSP